MLYECKTLHHRTDFAGFYFVCRYSHYDEFDDYTFDKTRQESSPTRELLRPLPRYKIGGFACKIIKSPGMEFKLNPTFVDLVD